MGKLKDLTGERFEMLTVVGRAQDGVTPAGKAIVQWRCVCECGRECIVPGNYLRSGQTKHCGCQRAKPSYYRGEDLDRKERPAPVTIKSRLAVGQTYTIIRKRWTLIQLCGDFARFRGAAGYVESFSYWELDRWRSHPEEMEEE